MKTQVQQRFIKEILSYLSTSEEELLYVGKPSAIILIPRFLTILLGLVVIYTLIHYITLLILNNLVLYMLGIVALMVFGLIISGLLVLDWLFNFYIVTNKKLLTWSMLHLSHIISQQFSWIRFAARK